MSNWAVKSEYVDLVVGSLAMESGRKPGIVRGDRVLVYDRTSDEDVEFTHSASVRGVTISGDQESGYAFKAELNDLTTFDISRRLGDFAYSLQKIYRFESPGRHFRNKYTSLTETDHSTLIDANIFWARTAFGYFMQPLPQATREQFVTHLALADPGSLIEARRYALLWGHLQNFIEQQYVSAYDLLQAISVDVEALADAGVKIDFADLRVGSGETVSEESFDFLSQQNQRIAEFIGDATLDSERAGRIGVFQSIDSRIREESDVEAKFETVFRGEPWPMPKT